tara:strand:- start:1841 stop:2407 length:567 start_codon:yes stop_codon:yes gene_type:complete
MSKKNFVGILGGTFDPPHEGHLFISNYAMKRLDLGEIWWIVTKKNPLKNGSSNFKKRLNIAKGFSLNRNIKIVEIHNEKKNIYTIDVLKYLFRKYPNRKFVWIMGVDNMKYFHLWKDWEKIFYNIPIAIFDRPSYSLRVSTSKVSGLFKGKQISIKSSKKLKYASPPKWVFISGLTHPQSSTAIRKNK